MTFYHGGIDAAVASLQQDFGRDNQRPPNDNLISASATGFAEAFLFSGSIVGPHLFLLGDRRIRCRRMSLAVSRSIWFG